MMEYLEPTQEQIKIALEMIDEKVDENTYRHHLNATYRYIGTTEDGYRSGTSLDDYEKGFSKEQMGTFWTLLWYHGFRVDKGGCLGYFSKYDQSSPSN